MDQATADALLSLVSQALQTAAEARLRLDAFERVMEGHNPGVAAAWRKEAESLRQQERYEADAASLAALRHKLLQG